jgi:DNA-binding GntR family transcriptional regulator
LRLKRPQSLYENIYSYIKEGILEGSFESNERINEASLARTLQVSRGPIREALRMIESEELLVRGERNRLYVYQPSVQDIQNIYQCRKVLESLAAKLAAERINLMEKSQIVKTIEKTQALMNHKRISGPEKVSKFAELSSTFHNYFIISSKNRRLEQQIDHLKNLAFFYRKKTAGIESTRNLVFKEHNSIAEAILANNIQLSGELMEKHIENDLTRLLEIYKDIHV